MADTDAADMDASRSEGPAAAAVIVATEDVDSPCWNTACTINAIT